MGSLNGEKRIAGDPLFRLMESIKCHECLDTNIAFTLYGPARCSNCAGQKRVWSSPALQLQRCIWTRIEKQQPVEKQPLALARALTHITLDAPIRLEEIAYFWRIETRAAKGTIALLRDKWLLPIGSLRRPPYGFYWIRSAEEFLAWSKPYRAQAVTSLVTVYLLQRQHWPRLHGQGEFNFIRMIEDEIQEAVK